MKAQFKYALRQAMPLRATAFTIMAVMNIVFGFLGYFNIWGNGGKITAVTLSSVALCSIFVINIIADVDVNKSLFSAPEGYLNAMIPVKSWKILLARSVSVIFEDILALAAGIAGVVLQSLILSGLIGVGASHAIGKWGVIGDVIPGMIMILLGYAYIVMLITFGSAICNSWFFSIRGRNLFTVLAVFGAAWAFNLLNIVLMPFGYHENWKIFYNITLTSINSVGGVAYMLLTCLKITVLFIVSANLMERKVNL